MHILRTNTSDHAKIVINSPEVQLGITRPHAEVGRKNIFIVGAVERLAQGGRREEEGRALK
jgi:hypothetical protein